MVVVYSGGKFRAVDGAQYAGEKLPGDLDGMQLYATDPNGFVKDTYRILCQRALTLFHTCAPVIGAINKHTDYAVGDGLEFVSIPDYETLGITLDESIEWGEKFSKLVYSEMEALNFFEKQRVLFRSALSGGDSILLFLREGNDFDLIELPGLSIDEKKEADNDSENITLGIRHDRFYRRQGYYDLDGVYTPFTDKKSGRQNAVMFYLKRFPRQLRGFPLCYSAISLAKNDDRHTDATLNTAVLESVFFASTKSKAPSELKNQIDTLADQAKKKKGVIQNMLESFGNVSKMLPGNMLHLAEGEEINLLDKKTPNSTFEMFKQWNLNYFGMATNTPPEVITSKYNTSYTAHKGALNDFEKIFMKERAQFVKAVCEPAVKELATNLILSGKIKAPGFFRDAGIQRAWLNGVWHGPRLSHINPAQEVNADISEADAGFALRSEKIFAKGGMSYRAFMRHWAAEQEEFKRVSPPPTAIVVNEGEGEEQKEKKEEEKENGTLDENGDEDDND
jgi:capsid protein